MCSPRHHWCVCDHVKTQYTDTFTMRCMDAQPLHNRCFYPRPSVTGLESVLDAYVSAMVLCVGYCHFYGFHTGRVRNSVQVLCCIKTKKIPHNQLFDISKMACFATLGMFSKCINTCVKLQNDRHNHTVTRYAKELLCHSGWRCHQSDITKNRIFQIACRFFMIRNFRCQTNHLAAPEFDTHLFLKQHQVIIRWNHG